MIQARFQVLDNPLPKPEGGYSRSPFGGGYTDTLDRLEREMHHLAASDIVILVDAPHEQIRNDGWPRSTMRPNTPGVIVTFETPVLGKLRYEAGKFNVWDQNLRAVAMTLERLRAVDRYGCTKGEQYTGWKALPAGIPAHEWSSAEEAMKFILQTAGLTNQITNLPEVVNDPEAVDVWFKRAARKAHPDAGGDHELMSKVNRARDYIGQAVAA